MPDRLTADDVSRLMADPSPEHRAGTAAKIAADFGRGVLSDRERKLAEDIFRVMVHDAEVRVREALAVNLQDSDELPQDVAMTLARDVETVSLPILEFSKVLSDEDLIEIVRSQSDQATKQQAIARRETVSDKVAGVLVDTGHAEVVETLVSNEGAKLSERTLERVVNDFGDQPTVQEGLVNRASLPVTISERLVAMVSEKLRETLVARHSLPSDVAADLVLETREQATVSLLSLGRDAQEVDDLVKQLKANNRLSSSLLLRALCVGDMRFFEAGIAALAGIPTINASKLITDQGPLGLKSLYSGAKLPPKMFPAFRAAVAVANETEYDGEPHDRERYIRRMIERFMTQIEEFEDNVSDQDVEYLLRKLERYAKLSAVA